jgi:excisionase family DNA binding protein
MNTPKAQEIRADSLLTSYQVGALLQVNPSSVNKWVKDGRIPAFRTPGGHRRIRAADLVAFLNEHKMPVPTSLAQASRRRLLIVDDDPRQLESLQRLLKPYADRVEVLLVKDGVDALVQVGSFKPHLVVLDVYMPTMDGLEVCRRLKAGAETAQIGIIMASGELTGELEKKATDAGAKRCLAKPIDLSTVLSELGIAQQSAAAAP